jgi:hypothetical protein
MIRNRLLSTALGLGLALGIGFAGAQTITKAIQLSQDATGSFGVDTFLGAYFPGHILSPTGGPRPAPTVTGTGAPTVSGTDTAGLITMGASATTAALAFGTAYASVPACNINWQNNLSAMTYTLATNVINITQTSTSSNKINYICFSAG